MIQAFDTSGHVTAPQFSRRSATMADATPDWNSVLAAMSHAFSTGDNPRGEELLISALDLGAPWDLATATVAQALSARGLPSRATLPAGAPA